MRFFHATGNKNAEAILKESFRDGTNFYLTDLEWSGVWISDKPFDDAHLLDGTILFAIEIPEDANSELEWPEEGKPYREWLVPATLLNPYGPPVVIDDYDDDEIVSYPDPGDFK